MTALGGVVITLKAGRVRFPKPHKLSSSQGPLHILPGQTLYLLTYEGEGFGKAWFNGTLYDGVDWSSFYNGACEFTPSLCTGTIVEKPRTEWWIQVRNAAGKIGWTSNAERFDNRDALGTR